MRRNIDISNIFIEVYKAYPASYIDRNDCECSNSIILPSSALEKFTSMKEGIGGSSNPVLFRILNINLNMYTHCGVLDFTAEEGVCYIPTNMFYRLCLNPGDNVNLRNIKLERGKFIKIQPHLTAFINLPKPKTILENALRTYFCVTQGDTIKVEFNKKYYDIDIIECKPKNAILILNQDIEVDFEKPLDYKEDKRARKEEAAAMQASKMGTSMVDFSKGKEKLNQEQMAKEMEDKKFAGHHMRIDGKDFTNNQIKKIMAQKKIQNKEENYNPRENRIPTKKRIPFHYVGNFEETKKTNKGFY